MVRVGVVNITGNNWNDATDIEIERIYVHPDYARPRKYHDLALLRLVKRVPFSRNVFPTCLYTGEADPTVPLTVTGWGITDITRAATSSLLLKATLNIVSQDSCNLKYSKSRKLPNGIVNEQLCARDVSGVMDTCQGDSGGPLQGLTGLDGHYRLVGVTSFGSGCGSPVPGVYTRVSKYLDWIESTVWSAA
ncbi:unnamed protein product [Parnassius mnemosyne]|uniref:Peptidase S1 domain-containing protein n=1 Tax=Parnassius mnemosyne TaxID=213953 RepID=A0AAV1KC91_9NEOP